MAKCYFTYSKENTPRKAESLHLILSYLKSKIESLSENTVSVTYDNDNVYDYINNHIADWIEEAIIIRNKYPK